MVEMDERETVLGSLKGYLAELLESGVDELPFTAQPVPGGRASSAALKLESARVEALPETRPQALQKPAPPAPEEGGGLSAQEEPFRIEGNARARLLFVMHGGGFAGEAGELLQKIVVAMGFSSDEVCLLSFAPGGVSSASLASRVASLSPEVVVSMGAEATSLLLQGDATLHQLRGRFHDLSGIPLMPTHHPEAMLENQGLKRDAWNDMQKVMGRLGKGR